MPTFFQANYSHNATQTEYDDIARREGHKAAYDRYPYSLVYKYAPNSHEWVMYFDSEDRRLDFAQNIKNLGGVILGATPALTNR